MMLSTEQTRAAGSSFAASNKARRERPTCKRGHLLSGENLYVMKNGGRVCRTCSRASHAKTRITGNISPSIVRRAVEEIYAGRTLNQLEGRNGSPCGFVVSASRFKAFLRSQPKLAAKLDPKLSANRHQSWRIAQSYRIIAAPAVLRNDGIDIFASITRATAGLHESIRDDVMGSMFIAASEGRLKLSDVIKRVREFVTAHNRMFSHYVPNGGGVMRSLDAAMNEDGFSLMDTIADGDTWSIPVSTGRQVSTRSWR